MLRRVRVVRMNSAAHRPAHHSNPTASWSKFPGPRPTLPAGRKAHGTNVCRHARSRRRSIVAGVPTWPDRPGPPGPLPSALRYSIRKTVLSLFFTNDTMSSQPPSVRRRSHLRARNHANDLFVAPFEQMQRLFQCSAEHFPPIVLIAPLRAMLRKLRIWPMTQYHSAPLNERAVNVETLLNAAAEMP
jgi:hypothetical protein